MGWLITTGIISLVFGVIFLIFSKFLQVLKNIAERPIAYLDGKVLSARVIIGVILIIAGGWLVSVAFSYPELWYLHLIGVLALFFGLLYLFLPTWLAGLSSVFDRGILSTDEVLAGSRKTVGIILIIASVYLFYSAYLIAGK